jgi:hypothetical protein
MDFMTRKACRMTRTSPPETPYRAKSRSIQFQGRSAKSAAVSGDQSPSDHSNDILPTHKLQNARIAIIVRSLLVQTLL